MADWHAAVDRLREAGKALDAARAASAAVRAEFEKIKPTMPADVRKYLYFGRIEYPTPFEAHAESHIVIELLKINTETFEDFERVYALFCEWSADFKLWELTHGVDEGKVRVEHLWYERRAAIEALMEIPARDLDMLAEKIAIAHQYEELKALEEIGRDVRRLAAAIGV